MGYGIWQGRSALPSSIFYLLSSLRMSSVFVCGSGAVSPAGWGVASLRQALTRGEPIPTRELARPGWNDSLRVRAVPAPSPRPSFLTHARLRRASPIAHHAVAVALEALAQGGAGGWRREGAAPANSQPASSLQPASRLGIVLCVMSGCVNYSRRFYDEALTDPATASPLVFPETVFNAPASHLAAVLGTTAINYTLVGDPGTYLQGLALGADWLVSGRVDGCLVIGAEEMDWLTTDAFRLFDTKVIVSDGAGALYLKREPLPLAPSPSHGEGERGRGVQLRVVTQPRVFSKTQTRAQAAQLTRADLAATGQNQLLCDGLQGAPLTDSAELAAWRDWTGPRLSPKVILGEGLMAAAAWQCVAAIDALQQCRYSAANVSVVGCNQQAIAAQFGPEE